MERLSEEGVAYCLTIGEGAIYGLLYPQIKELYETMGRFIERENHHSNVRLKTMTDMASISARILIYMGMKTISTLIIALATYMRIQRVFLPDKCKE